MKGSLDGIVRKMPHTVWVNHNADKAIARPPAQRIGGLPYSKPPSFADLKVSEAAPQQRIHRTKATAVA